MNIEQLLEAAKIIEQRDEGEIYPFLFENFVAHVVLTPR